MLCLLGLLCIGQVLLWSLAFGLSYTAPEIDSAEQFVWAFSLENGYWKHPPMPSWIMHGLIQVFGPSVALPFVATQVSIVLALALTWRLGCEFMSPSRALIAMALTSLVTYHNMGGDSFNHNTALLPFQAATVLLFFLSTRRGAWHLWALTGLFAGLTVLVKYVAILPLAGLLLYFLLDRSLHRRSQWLGLLLASGVFALVILPHVLWLTATEFMPFRYARAVARAQPGTLAALGGLADFALIQLLRLLPFLLGLWFVFAPRRGNAAAGAPALPAIATGDRLFVWVVGLAPLSLAMLIGLLSETELQSRWGANAFLLSGVLAMVTMRRADTPSMLNRTLAAVALAHLVLSLGMTLAKTALADQLHWRTRANFPGAVLAREARETWAAHTRVPLRLVVSDIWLGGNIVANNKRRIAVLIDGRHLKSPWIKDDAVDNCGALVLDDLTQDSAGRAAPDPALDALMARADVTGTWTLPWAKHVSAPSATGRGLIRWGIILPRSTTSCTLK
ncbi:glycosyltransferase family 39 protein [Rhodoferax sp.]|uniref:glycosyltransferase family 39 protein n=1 Tax=Rhodoferax sp. TaxID=50421 RepID=UPI0039B92B76